ncbi:MAG: hypothetical protein DRQ43_09430, partial [Gammaproteobacteria bacterium]
MPEINYNIKLATQGYSSSLSNGSNPVSTNEHFRTVDPIGLIEELIHPLELDNGWEYEQSFYQSKNKVAINNITRIENGSRIVPSLRGIVISPYEEIFLNTDDFFNFIGDSPVMGARSSGLGVSAMAFIFKRNEGKVSIEEEFQYVHINAIEDKILDSQFSELYSEEDGYDYVVFGMQAPNPISQYKNSSLELSIMDFIYSSSDYTYIPSKYSISEKDFLSLCDYQTLKRGDLEDPAEDIYTWTTGESGAVV